PTRLGSAPPGPAPGTPEATSGTWSSSSSALGVGVEGGELVLGERLQDEALEPDLLRHLVGVQLEADGRLLDALGVGLAPVGDEGAVEHEADAVALGEDLDFVPVVLLADLLRPGPVLVDHVPAVQVVEAVAGGEHDEVAGVGVGVALVGGDPAPQRD